MNANDAGQAGQDLEVAAEAPVPAAVVTGASGADPSRARAAGRGGVAVLGAKAYFIVISFAQQLLLAKAIGVADYGALSRVLAVANIVNNVMIAASVQGVSRAVARASGEEGEGRAFRSALRVHFPVAVFLAILFACAAPAVGAFERAPHIVLPLIAMSGVVLLYGMYGPLVGMLNGTGQFTKQATLDVIFATVRTATLVGLGWTFVRSGGSGTLGAAIGFVVAAAVIVPLALRWTGFGKPGASESVPSASTYLVELGPLVLAQLFTNLLFQADITLLGRFLSISSAATGSPDAMKNADEWVGVYRACQLFAFLPYQLLMSVTQILFPMLARAKAEGDAEAVRTYVRKGVRTGTVACGLMVMVVVALPGQLLEFAFGAAFAARGADTLRVLTLGQGAFALMGIAVTALASLGRERLAAGVTFLALLGVGATCWITVHAAAFGQAQLLASAVATSCALLGGLVAAALLVRGLTGAFSPPITFVRVGAALVVAYFVGPHIPHFGKLMTPVLAAAMGVLYLVIMIVTGELGKDDLQLVKSIAGRGKR